jgi:hypothetical protein
MRSRALLALASLSLLATLPLEAAGSGLRFAIVQPGYPGSSESASGFLDALAAYIEASTALGAVKGSYHNVPKEALEALEKERPHFGIVSLGFYLEHRRAQAMRPLLETLPHERFYVVSTAGKALKPADLAGKKVVGGALYEPEFLSKIVFPGAQGAVSWDGEPTLRSFRALRRLEAGEIGAILLSGREHDSLEKLGRMKTLEKIQVSEYYPVALLVIFEPRAAAGEEKTDAGSTTKPLAGPQAPPAGAEELVLEAFTKMASDREGKTILETMGCQRFGRIRARWLEELEKSYEAEKK